MEIPYTVHSRPDTGLWNAKIGIWLFLASEVMLFGGLFSGYVFLRLGAPSAPGLAWPTHVLNVPLGFTNTLVLIASSVTVILAWAALKLREYRNYKIFMGLTLALACLFLVIKSFEYGAKFKHYGVFLKDGSVVTGHDLKVTGDAISIVPDPAKDAHGGHGGSAGHGEKAAEDAHAHEPVVIPMEQVRRWSNHGPKYNTFYSIYFTLTGLHALHVIGGMCVLAYLLFFGGPLYARDPEHLANRVEVGGLFWHFVDLVWIFLFPVLYLM